MRKVLLSSRLGPKNSSTGKLLLNSILMLIGRGCGAVSSVLLVYILAYWLGAAEVGRYSLAVKYTSVLLGLSSLGLEGALIRDTIKEPNSLFSYLKVSTLIRFCSSLILLMFTALFTRYLSGYKSGTVHLILLYGLNLIPESLYRLYQSAMVALDKYPPIAVVGILRLLGGVSGTLFLLSRGKSVASVVVGVSLVNAASTLLLLFYLGQSIRSRGCCSSTLRLPLRFGDLTTKTFYFAVADLLFTMDWQVDIIILSFFCDEATIGVYGVAQSVLSFLMLILYAVDMVIYSFITRSLQRGWQFVASAYRRLSTVIIIGVLFVVVVVMSGSIFWNIRVMGNEFVAMLLPLRWLIFSWGLHFVNVPAARLIMSTGNTKCVALFLGVSVLVNIILSIVLIQSLGLIAPAVARFFSALVYTLSCTVFALRLIKEWNE